MLSRFIIFTATIFSFSTFAVNDLKSNIACWDSQSPKGSRPVLTFTAHYSSKDRTGGANLSEVRVPNSERKYEFLARSYVGVKQGSLIETLRSPYVGHYEYNLATGVRLILNNDVSINGLKNADVDGRGRGHAAILDVSSSVHGLWSGGSLYIRMRCGQQ